jgi:glycerol-3-phosphate dehydrogenase
MIHGGLRYLENREFGLVRESLYERNRLLDNAPHYVAPLKTTIPLFSRLGGFLRSALIFFGFSVRPGSRGSFITNLGLTYYDLVTRKDRRTPIHYLTGRAKALRTIPGLNPKIVATATYWDAMITEAERLCIEMIHDARQANPDCQALNYVAPQRIEGGRVVLKDGPTGETVTVAPQIVVNATGAWVDITNDTLGLSTQFMGGTKGSHLVVDCPQLHRALGDQMVYYQHVDGRVCIVFPFMDKVLMGSTDIPVDDPDKAVCDAGEIEYMLTTLQGMFPGIHISRDQIIFTFCGVRPLPSSKHAVTANISRGHSIAVIAPDSGRPFPMFCLIGGKWTTFRAFAEQAGDKVLTRLGLARKCSTTHLPIGGGKDCPRTTDDRTKWIQRVAQASRLPEPRVSVLFNRYGTSAETYARSATRESEKPLQSLPDFAIGEIRKIVTEEQVIHLTDLVCRRTLIAVLGAATPAALREIAEIAGAALGWDESQMQSEIHLAMTEVATPQSKSD